MDNEKIYKIIPFLLVLPALLLGIYTMYYFKIPTIIWATNLILGIFCILIGLISLYFHPFKNTINSNLIVVVSLLLLLTTFLNEGAMGVHRWIGFGSIKINIGLIVSPILIIQLAKFQNIKLAFVLVALVTLIFTIQPDASQVTAFAISTSIMLISKLTNRTAALSIILFAFIATAISWYNLDNLEPVNYVENIIQMAGEINKSFTLLSLISLVLLVLPFFTVYSEKKKIIAIALGFYYIFSILSTFIGNFPVMIMGYGISPIIGYFIGLTWLMVNEE